MSSVQCRRCSCVPPYYTRGAFREAMSELSFSSTAPTPIHFNESPVYISSKTPTTQHNTACSNVMMGTPSTDPTVMLSVAVQINGECLHRAVVAIRGLGTFAPNRVPELGQYQACSISTMTLANDTR